MLFRKTEPLTDFERVTLLITGMRYREKLEAMKAEDGVAIAEYECRYTKDGEEWIPEAHVTMPFDEYIAFANDCRLTKWDGFSGKNPPGVLDGTMFSMEALVNDGKRIRADGSNNFPKGYREYVQKLHELLYEAKKAGTDAKTV